MHGLVMCVTSLLTYIVNGDKTKKAFNDLLLKQLFVSLFII